MIQNKKIQNKNQKNKKSFWKKWGQVIILGVIVFVLPLVFFLLLKNPKIRNVIKYFVTYLRKNQSPKTYILFLGFIIFMSVIISNSAIPNLISGMIFGTKIGSILTSIGILISGSISFFISRYLFKEDLTKNIKDNKLLKKYYDKIIDSEKSLGTDKMLELVFLSRLAPVAPFHPFSYFWGVSNVDYWVFLLGTLGVIPTVIFETYIGSQFSDIDQIFENKTKFLHVGIMIAISVVIGWLINKLIDDSIKKKKRLMPTPTPTPKRRVFTGGVYYPKS